MVGDVDDLYWNARTKQVYISGGDGAVDIFKQADNVTYKQIAHIKTRDGARGGFELFPAAFNRHWLGRWLNTGVAHNQHHQFLKGNYGLYFTI